MQTIIMAIRTTLLRAGYLLLCCYASLSYAAPTAFGDGYFEGTYFSDFQWHIDQDGYAVIDRAAPVLEMFLGQTPCQDYLDKLNKIDPKAQGTFVSCKIERELCTLRGCKHTTLFNSTNARALSLSQLSNLLSATGKVEFFSSSGEGGGMMFSMQLVTSKRGPISYLPRRGGGGGGADGIPNTPVELPARCSASNVTIDHKTLSVADLQGNTATGSLEISCNKEASVQIKITDYNHAKGIDLTNDRSLISRLTLDGTTADRAKNISVPGWGTSVEIKSVLERTGETVTPGRYSKTVVALMTVN